MSEETKADVVLRMVPGALSARVIYGNYFAILEDVRRQIQEGAKPDVAIDAVQDGLRGDLDVLIDDGQANVVWVPTGPDVDAHKVELAAQLGAAADEFEKKDFRTSDHYRHLFKTAELMLRASLAAPTDAAIKKIIEDSIMLRGLVRRGIEEGWDHSDYSNAQELCPDAVPPTDPGEQATSLP